MASEALSVKHLYFCRHGESVLNKRRRFAGHIDTPLTDRGREQAAKAGTHADTLKLDLIISSPLSRALDTARIIAAEANYPLDKIITNELFIELSWGPLEGKSFFSTLSPETHPGVESQDALAARAQSALEYLQSLEAENILLVGHGSFSGALRGLIQPDHNHHELPNAEIVQLL